MDYLALLTLALAFITGRQASFPLTVHGRHELVTITRNPTASHTSWTDALGVAWQIYNGGSGTLTSGVFSVNVQPLDPAPTQTSAGPTSATYGTAGSGSGSGGAANPGAGAGAGGAAHQTGSSGGLTSIGTGAAGGNTGTGARAATAGP
jgi:hypothetical protein